MPTINIAAPRNRAVHVTVYEPRQTPEQEEVILDEFDLKAGEVREDYELRSATAAYRTSPLAGADAVDDRADEAEPDRFANIPDAQDGTPTEQTNAEIEAGRQASSEPEGKTSASKTRKRRSSTDDSEEK